MKKDKLFYVALAVGLIALCSALTLYSRKSTQQGNGQLIDLNEQGNLTKNETKSTEDTEDIASVLETDKKEKKKNDKTSESENDRDKESGNKDAAGTLNESDPDSDDTQKQTEPDDNKESSLSYAGEQSMVWPVKGNVVLPFSMETTVYFKTMDQYQCNPGMLIAARKGTAVKAAEDGIVKSISKDEKLGSVIEIEVGNGYCIKYGQIDNVAMEEGDRVVKGMQIATVAAPTRFYEKEGEHVYMEVTKDGEPFDPLTVLTD